MAAPLSIEGMSVAEKIGAMELLWDDLRGRAEANLSPDWHADESGRRAQALADGHEHVEDWEGAKRRIRDDVN